MVVATRPLRGSRLASFFPSVPVEGPSRSDLDSAFQLQEYIALLIRKNPHDVETIVSLPGRVKMSGREDDKSDLSQDKGDVVVDEALAPEAVHAGTVRRLRDATDFLRGDEYALLAACRRGLWDISVLPGPGRANAVVEVVIIITGAHKAPALQRCIEGGVNHMWTLSSLQMHPHPLIVVDEDATLELQVKTVKVRDHDSFLQATAPV